jgi:hypothetical protein
MQVSLKAFFALLYYSKRQDKRKTIFCSCETLQMSIIWTSDANNSRVYLEQLAHAQQAVIQLAQLLSLLGNGSLKFPLN